eukprot:scaffold23477_cov60-Phaeocystis_antarctica.AAC.1
MRRSCATCDRAASCIDVCALSGHRRQRMPSVGTRESERSEAPFFCACIVLGLPFPGGQDGLATRRSCATRNRAASCIEVCALSGHRRQRMRSARVNRSAAKRHFSAP